MQAAPGPTFWPTLGPTSSSTSRGALKSVVRAGRLFHVQGMPDATIGEEEENEQMNHHSFFFLNVLLRVLKCLPFTECPAEGIPGLAMLMSLLFGPMQRYLR